MIDKPTAKQIKQADPDQLNEWAERYQKDCWQNIKIGEGLTVIDPPDYAREWEHAGTLFDEMSDPQLHYSKLHATTLDNPGWQCRSSFSMNVPWARGDTPQEAITKAWLLTRIDDG